MTKKIIIGILLFSGLVFAAAQTKYYGDILMQGHKIIGLATDPSDSTSAATKGYVDAADATKLPLSGGSSKPMTGNLYMGTSNDKHQIKNVASPSSDYDAANKTWTVNTFLPRSGGNITGTIDMNFHPLINPATNNIAWNYVVNRRYVNQEDELVASNANAALTNLAANVDSALAKKLSISGGSMSGDIVMQDHKVSGLAAPSASADAATKGYVDTLVLNSPSLIDSFLFYTLEGGSTNFARVFDLDSTGGYVRVTMLADNADGQYGMTATLSDSNDNVQLERTEFLSKAGQGFKLWLTSNQTNDHYSSIKVRDAGNGCGVALARFKFVEAPDWDLYVCSNTSVPSENRFSYQYMQEMMFDIHKAYYSGIFAFVVGVSNTTSRTIKCQIDGDAKGFYYPASYSLSFVGSKILSIAPYSCAYIPAYVNDYDDNAGAAITLTVANGVLQQLRTYRTFWSWSGMIPDQNSQIEEEELPQ